MQSAKMQNKNKNTKLKMQNAKFKIQNVNTKCKM